MVVLCRLRLRELPGLPPGVLGNRQHSRELVRETCWPYVYSTTHVTVLSPSDTALSHGKIAYGEFTEPGC